MVKKVEVFEDRNGGLHREEAVAIMVEARADVKHAVESCIYGDRKFALDDFLSRVQFDEHVRNGLRLLISDTINPDAGTYVLIDCRNTTTKVEAIKLVRCISGMGLKEAKDWVEEMEPLIRAPAGWCGPVPNTGTPDVVRGKVARAYPDITDVIMARIDFRTAG